MLSGFFRYYIFFISLIHFGIALSCQIEVNKNSAAIANSELDGFGAVK